MTASNTVDVSIPIVERGASAPFISVAGGHQLFVRNWGTGQPIVLLAGWGMDSRCWGETMIRLNRSGFRTIAYDRRGHGRSTDPGAYDYDSLSDDLAAVLDRLLLSDVILVGHSGAGGEIIRYLSRYGAGRARNYVHSRGATRGRHRTRTIMSETDGNHIPGSTPRDRILLMQRRVHSVAPNCRRCAPVAADTNK
jgi:pimeloyl-ACP methyl ester carboxylesterase